MDFNNFVSIDSLNNFVSMIIIVNIVTQALKVPVNKLFTGLPAQGLAFVVSIAVFFAIRIAIDPSVISLNFVITGIFNALFISLASMKGYEKVKEIVGGGL